MIIKGSEYKDVGHAALHGLHSSKSYLNIPYVKVRCKDGFEVVGEVLDVETSGVTIGHFVPVDEIEEIEV